MRTTQSPWLILLLAIASTACSEYPPAGHGAGGGGEGGSGGSSGAGGLIDQPAGSFDSSPVPLEDACETWALAKCRGEARCHEIPSRYVGTCAELLIASSCFFRFEPDVVDGYVIYDGAAWGRCLARLADEAHCSAVLYQDVFLGQDRDCRSAFAGTVPAGGTCLASDWCESGQCDREFPCPGHCSSHRLEGEACVHDWDCGYPLICEDGRCRGPGKDDDRCSWNYPLPTPQCRDGLFCIDSRCTPPLPDGAACEEYGLPCETGLRCDWRTRSCERPPGPGEPCDNAESQPCRHDLGCDRDLGVCVEGKGPGEPCIAGLTPWRTGCALVFQCIEESFRSGHCGQGPGIGDPCEETGPRCEGATCDDGVCRAATSIPGSRCDELHRCFEGDCVDGICVSEACGG